MFRCLTYEYIGQTVNKVIPAMDGQDNWPVCDEDGYYKSYKKGGRWQNHWRRNKPNNFKVIYSLHTSTNMNGASDDVNIDDNLPIIPPYWLDKNKLGDKTESRNVGSKGIRATWIGHATVLAEIDGLIVLCDPIFSTYCGPDYIPSSLTFKVKIIILMS